MQFVIKRAQSESEILETFKYDSTRLNLQKNSEGIYVCKGRIQGEYPVYLPAKHVLSEMVVKQAHAKTLHRGVGLIMSKVREEYWIPKLRALAKKSSVIMDVSGSTQHQNLVHLKVISLKKEPKA